MAPCMHREQFIVARLAPRPHFTFLQQATGGEVVVHVLGACGLLDGRPRVDMLSNTFVIKKSA